MEKDLLELIEYTKLAQKISSPEGLLKNLSKINIDGLLKRYTPNTIQPINNIRNKLLNKLKIGECYTFEELFQMKTDAGVGKSMNNSFLSFVYTFIQEEPNSIIDKLCKKLLSDLDITHFYKISKHVFTGNRNGGDDRIWIALHPKNLSFKNCWQFYIGITPEGIECGKSSGKDLFNDYKQDLKYDIQTYQEILQQFLSQKNDILTLNNSLLNDTNIKILQEEKGNNSMTTTNNTQPLNQILYGPPGTGKTYNTISYAVATIEEKSIDEIQKEDYSAVKDRFNEYKTNHQIEFVTFHQSYSYEEFVEGIKPNLESDELTYKMEDGIFKNICERAKRPIIKNNNNEFKLNDNPKIWKVSLMKTGDNEVRKDCMDNNRIRIGWSKYGETITDETVFDDGGSRVLTAFINKMEIGDIVLSCYSEKTIDAIGVITSEYKWNNKFDNFKRYRDVKWLVKGLNYDILQINNGKKFTLGTVYQLNNISLQNVFDIMDKQEKIATCVENDTPHVLIIDEINRGNISKIFGELITLIEPDKRIGEDHELKVTLPYSQDSFGVPNNLYIIGTMNTSDRSIASVDIALRRRFKFVEMMPKPKLIDINLKDNTSINLENILTKLNQRISILLDRDHQIGHSYFMNWDNYDVATLQQVWFDSIMPLLNEYFYGDWDKLKAILGEAKSDGTSFILKIDKPSFACSYDCESDDCYDFTAKDNIKFKEALNNAGLI